MLIAASHRLRAGGYHVRTARDGNDALALAVSERADLAIMDIKMPGLDGFETLDRLRTLPGWDDVPDTVRPAAVPELPLQTDPRMPAGRGGPDGGAYRGLNPKFAPGMVSDDTPPGGGQKARTAR